VINGVKISVIKTHEDNRGYFREIFRFSEEFSAYPVGQLSHSYSKENIVKFWHGHVYQYQWNHLVTGSIKVALYDNRKESSTYGNFMEFLISNEINPKAYFFPPGVLHGYKCLEGPMHIIYATSGVYDIKDEVRISNEEINYDGFNS